jgi:hypothetical protein
MPFREVQILARRLLRRGRSDSLFQGGDGVHYTIESRPLTTEYTHRPSLDDEPRQVRIEAANPESAISEYVRRSELELVSMTKPLTGRESVATVRKNDSVFLVRVYGD